MQNLKTGNESTDISESLSNIAKKNVFLLARGVIYIDIEVIHKNVIETIFSHLHFAGHEVHGHVIQIMLRLMRKLNMFFRK